MSALDAMTVAPLRDAGTAELERVLRAKIDGKTKPLGSLGRIEALALQLGLMQGSLTPQLNSPQVLLFAGDHGAAREGVSAYPRDVTWQMVRNFLAGGAAICVFARLHGLALTVVDAGVDHEFAPHPQLIDAKLARGTGNSLIEPAMSAAQCDAAVARGAAIVTRLHETGCNTLILGEMGIGNTAAASLLVHALTGWPLDDCVGRGTGLDDAGLARKRALLARAAARAGRIDTPAQALREFGGFEMAQLAGAMLAAAQRRMAIVIDGFIVGSVVLAASRAQPALLDYCVFAHRSAEAAHGALLRALGAEPLLDLELRLGEGTGAALAFPLLRAAEAFLNQMASFESAGVSRV
jgi:nicotinate-nucleotide--dimethylbenzimidazole phosphoribosyltransferase